MTSRLHAVLWADRDAQARTLMAVGFAVACIIYLAVIAATGIETEVMRDRFWKNAEPLFHGQFPPTEYPPLAMVFFAIPRLFGTTAWGYEVAYVAQMWVFIVVGLLLTDRMAVSMGRSRCRSMCVYSLLVLVLLEFVLDRFDMIVAVFMLAALVLFIEKRTSLSFAMLAVATLLKVIPVVLFPVFAVSLMADGRQRDAAKGTVVYILVGALTMAAFWIIEPASVTSFLTYNGTRPLQIESVPAALLYPLSMTGTVDMWIQSATDPGSFMSDNLRGPIPDAIASVLLPFTVVATAAVWLLSVSGSGSRCAPGHMALACAACMLMFLATNKVYSSQYLIWVVPFIILIDTAAPEGQARRIMSLFVALLVLTQINFAYNVGHLGGGSNIDDAGMMILLARAVVHIVLLGICLKGLACRSDAVVGSRNGASLNP